MLFPHFLLIKVPKSFFSIWPPTQFILHERNNNLIISLNRVFNRLSISDVHFQPFSQFPSAGFFPIIRRSRLMFHVLQPDIGSGNNKLFLCCASNPFICQSNHLTISLTSHSLVPLNATLESLLLAKTPLF